MISRSQKQTGFTFLKNPWNHFKINVIKNNRIHKQTINNSENYLSPASFIFFARIAPFLGFLVWFTTKEEQKA